ncbi:hypothetical protein [Chlorogloea sp. CCALA 695]|uniref:hypothetical protein n=1 Tax=Chlorogloea sp. CCALA 695 TaxID=2107693 RepID=UPI000D0530ED|nr:hypothetical protein [Chlorogloea sp. CCALA 695]PSB29356.1 hypothetical protein C7B70_18475 [Chlorogloea sp. CCALA 695]
MSKLLKVAIPALSLISITTIPQSALAAVSCETNTANNHSNNSLASCVLSFDANIGLGNNYFACQQKNSISFDEKGQFESCTLGKDLQLRNGNKVTNCLAKGTVNVSISTNGIQTVNCSIIAAN